MNDDIKKIEDLSINAWPSYQIEFYDGWVLRYSAFYTHRTNCGEQLGLSQLPLAGKIPVCEQIYRHWHSPCIFKISPVGDPGTDPLLEGLGYQIEHTTDVMLRSLTDDSLPELRSGAMPLTILPRVTFEWIDGLFALKGTSDPVFRRIVPQMYDAIPMDEIAVLARSGGRVVATGLGILDRDAVGVYAIHVDETYRRHGLAWNIVSTILREGRKQGASSAYLQVVSGNAGAKALDRRIGFRYSYRYWFRVKEV